MSMELQDLEAKLLIDKLNRRAKLLATIQRGNRRSEWGSLIFLLPLGFFVYTLIGQAFDNDEALALWMIIVMMTAIIPTCAASVDARMNALIEFLREDGMLEGTPPAAKCVSK